MGFSLAAAACGCITTPIPILAADRHRLSKMRIAPLAFAVVVAALAVWRWARLGWPLRTVALGLTGALVLYGAGVIHLPRTAEAALDEAARGELPA